MHGADRITVDHLQDRALTREIMGSKDEAGACKVDKTLPSLKEQ